MSERVQIDGSRGEGGGQILRTAATLSAITGLPLEITNIRAGRAKPGLQAQHLMAVRAAAQLCRATLHGDAVGSVFLSMEPTLPVQADHYSFDIGTAGSTSLVIQTVLPALATAAGESSVTVSGGTHNPFAPTADYLEQVYLSTLSQHGWQTEYLSERAGYNPIGGGDQRISLAETPAMRPFKILERRGDLRLSAFIVTSGLPAAVGERGADQLRKRLKDFPPIQIHQIHKPSKGIGAAVLVVAEGEGYRAGFTGLGELRLPMESVSDEPCDAFLAWEKTGAPLEEHLADQLVLPAALTQGRSSWRTSAVTEHLRTVLWVVEQFLPVRTSVDEVSGIVTVTRD